MGQESSRQMLLEWIEMTLAKWGKLGFIAEGQLYDFLYILKGTTDTLGLKALSDFCASQLETLSYGNDSKIPVPSLGNFSNRIKSFLDGTGEEDNFSFPEVYRNRFDEETFVLIIDSELEFIAFVKELLETMGAQVIIAMNGKRGIEQFYSMRPNFVLIDLKLPDMSGFEILDQIKDTANARQVTMMITSVDRSRKNRMRSFERGAMDFIAKPIDSEVFIPYLFNRDEIRKSIGKSVYTDGLTGVGNRRHFDNRIHFFTERYNQSAIPFSCVMMDLDHFKQVNDMYGHLTGDEVLRKLGEVLKAEKKETDDVFRYGGEEFIILLSGVESVDAAKFVERLRTTFNEIVFQEAGKSFSVTFSAGVATYDNDVEKLISSADQALYEAKRTGRNQTLIFDERKSHVNRKLHIIIVDDDTLIRIMLQEKLMEWTIPDIDISVQVFSDGLTFLEADWYSPEAHYIVLLDGVMPGMDGLEVLSRLKREKVEKNILVSMMTARTGDSDIKAALWLGADDYIMKPFKPADVLSRIQQLTNRLFN